MRSIGRALATLAAFVGATAFAQPGAAVYTCVDASGRRISSDRPITECMDRQQRILNPSGTTRQSVGPALSETERATQDELRRREELERLRVNEERLRQRALLSRYPDAQALERDRKDAIAPLEEVIASAAARLATLDAERARLQATSSQRSAGETAGALEQIDLQRGAQERFLASKRAERDQLLRRFTDMAHQLEAIWRSPATAQPAPPAAAR